MFGRVRLLRRALHALPDRAVRVFCPALPSPPYGRRPASRVAALVNRLHRPIASFVGPVPRSFLPPVSVHLVLAPIVWTSHRGPTLLHHGQYILGRAQQWRLPSPSQWRRVAGGELKVPVRELAPRP